MTTVLRQPRRLMPTTFSLDTAPLRRRLRVVQLLGSEAIGRRLHDMGFWPGTEVEATQRAPLNDPTVYSLRGFRLALRAEEAAVVQVELVVEG